MKGIILAGGLGSRLRPLTKVTNKHLLPVYDKPMIYYPLETLCKAGITDIMVVTGGNSAGEFLRLLGNGREFGLKDIYYTYQEGEGGIADALKLTEHFAEGQRICVILGDNILQDDISPYLEKFKEQSTGARLLLKEVSDPQRFGVPEFEGQHIVGIEEKPARPKSTYAVTGVYMYDHRVFDFARQLTPSARGELEISDVNNAYIKEGDLHYDVLSGWWSDAGQFESLHRASTLVASQRDTLRAT
ncbi:MAG: sugar phosphate nucleotidyltransferase [Candidatus Eremiobacteraeota bacterium]|nr:sugar phosphate nucleotidyltransferase [Candidatus Eremiobacteraeota bacterium]MDQ6933585.1 sugar phosphate nucleotidyltransferase [Candidatus Eremiobacteraeota bacterium]